MVRVSNPGGGEIFCTRPDRPWGPPSLLYNGYFPGIKRLGRDADHPPPSKGRGHERVGLYFYSPSGPQWPFIGRKSTILHIVTVAGIAKRSTIFIHSSTILWSAVCHYFTTQKGQVNADYLSISRVHDPKISQTHTSGFFQIE